MELGVDVDAIKLWGNTYKRIDNQYDPLLRSTAQWKTEIFASTSIIHFCEPLKIWGEKTKAMRIKGTSKVFAFTHIVGMTQAKRSQEIKNLKALTDQLHDNLND